MPARRGRRISPDVAVLSGAVLKMALILYVITSWPVLQSSFLLYVYIHIFYMKICRAHVLGLPETLTGAQMFTLMAQQKGVR